MAHNRLTLPPTWLSTPRKDQHRKMHTALLNTCTNEFHTDPKYSILYGGLFAASQLNKGQTLFQDMCDRTQGGAYGRQSELALIPCKYNLEIIIFENGTQQWVQRPTGIHQEKHVIALRWCRQSIHYDWLKRIKPIEEMNSTDNSDEPKRVNHLPESLTLGPTSTDTDNLSPPTSQESNRSRQPKKSSRCLNSSDDVEIDSTDTFAECNQLLHRPGSPELGPNFRDADNLSPPTPKESNRSRQPKNKSSRCSSSGNKGMIDSQSDSDVFGEEVIYSQKSPQMDEIIRDFDWQLGRFVAYRSPLTRNNSSVIDNQRNEIKKSN
jgi:hypothetical protein